LGKCIIFCAAEFDRLAEPIQENDFILAADGGLNHLKRLGITPNEILGDFDSLGYAPIGANVFPVEKDDTDAMLAARRGLELGFREFLFYGSLDGPRLDHTIANFQTLQFLADNGATGYLIGNTYLATVITNETLIFPAGAEGILSLFCLGPDAKGVSIEGLHYPLQNGTLTSGFPLGVSNHFTGRQARITVSRGSLLCLWDRKSGFPQRKQS
jgi:thiamine pyrophosphokinase